MPKKAQLLHQTNLFKHLTEDQLQTFYAQTLPESFNQGDIIVREGDIGDRLYIIIEGAVRVFTYDKENNEVVLARLETGNYFGEQALLAAEPIQRNASVKALTFVKTLSISHDTFLKQLQKNHELQQILEQQGKIQLLTKLEKQLHERKGKETGLLSLFSDTEFYGERQVFFRQGDEAKYAYYLLSGAVEIRFYDEKQQLKFRSQIRPGQFFGELGILENSPRTGTAVAMTDSIVFVISSAKLKSAYDQNPELRALMNTLLRIYKIPAFGLMSQYQGNFLEKPAIQTTIQRDNGDKLLASRVIDSQIFAIAYENIEPEQQHFFEDKPDHLREIKLYQNQLISVTSIGYWEDLNDICRLVYEKTLLTPDMVKQFSQTGKIAATGSAALPTGNLCECMRVTFKTINELILTGITTVEEISQCTGAGTICGGCRPRIIDLLGGDAWTYVKIGKIIEHNSHVRSYQLQPINRKICNYQAGQHIVVEAEIDNRWIARTYTLTSADSNEKYYEITVKREPKGLFSRWLFDHGKTGMIFRIAEPQGHFILDPTEKPAICFMGGIGITPAIAFARKLIASHNKRVLHIDYSVHDENDFSFQHEFAEWPEHYPNVITQVRVTRQQGHITEMDIRRLLLQYQEAEIYVCGPDKFEHSLCAVLKRIGIPEERIHLEVFSNAGGPTR